MKPEREQLEWLMRELAEQHARGPEDRYDRLRRMDATFSARFRKVSNRYPRRVAQAYGRDTARAMRGSDEQVAATVAAWERSQGLEPVDWYAIGRRERRP